MTEHATVAGGCFWCIQAPFEHTDGVIRTLAGYAGGSAEDAHYTRVCSGHTQHREAVDIEFDPRTISYAAILDIFWRQIDPTDPGGQFNDQGPQYTTAIFVRSAEQQRIAEKSKMQLAASGKFTTDIATVIVPFTTFFPAEDEHQHYAENNPLHYMLYKKGSGRAAYIHEQWKE